MYASNSTLESIAQRLRHARSVLVLTHLKPDGDAIGSSIALVRALNLTTPAGLPPRAKAWYSGPFPPWQSDVVKNTPHALIDPKQGPDRHADFEAIVVIDTGSWTQLEPFADFLKGRAEETIIVDHHRQGHPEIADTRFIEPNFAAACQPAAELCRLILGLPSLGKLPVEVATPLYLGICTDTGWFRHSNVSPTVLHTAAELIEAGVNHTGLYQLIEQRDTLGRQKLLSRALASLTLELSGRVGVMSLTKADFAESKAEPGESGGFIDFPSSIPTVRVSVLLTEGSDWQSSAEGGDPAEAKRKIITKISMRSKEGTNAVDVNAVAQEFGGGGHIRAAGARLDASIDDTRRKLLESLARHLETAR